MNLIDVGCISFAVALVFFVCYVIAFSAVGFALYVLEVVYSFILTTALKIRTTLTKIT
jgi:hypothetical protein